MKKALIAIFALIYLGSTIGATVQMHYCMGKLANWNLGHKSSAMCAKCGMGKSEKNTRGCCKDEHNFVKNATDQNATAALQILHASAIALPVSFYELPANHFVSLIEGNPISHGPPLFNRIAVYIRNRAFLL